MDSPHRQSRSIARTNARQERSSPYSRPRNLPQTNESGLTRAPSSSFLDLLGRAVSWWVGGPDADMTLDEEASSGDEHIPVQDVADPEREGTMTPVGPPGGFSSSRARPPSPIQEDDDEVQIISPSVSAARPVRNSPPSLSKSMSLSALARANPPFTPQHSISRASLQTENKSPEQINAAISDFFSKKGSEPLSVVEWNGIQKMLEELRGGVNGDSQEPFRLGAPAYSVPTFHPGTPDQSSKLRATRSTTTPRRTFTPGRSTPPIYIGPGFGSGGSRLRSSAKPSPRQIMAKANTPTPGEKTTALTRSTLSVSMLAGPSHTPATPTPAEEPANPSLSRLTRKPNVSSPLRNAISQNSTSPTSDRVAPPKRGPTIAASLLKDLMDAGKRDSKDPFQNPYLSRPGAIKGKLKPKAKPSPDRPVTPSRAETKKPVVNGVKVPEPPTGTKRDAETAALDEAPVPKPSIFSNLGPKEPFSLPSPPASKKPRTSFADAQEVVELLEEKTPKTPEVAKPPTSEETAKPASTTPTSLFGINGGLSFPKPTTITPPSFGLPQDSSSKLTRPANPFASFGPPSGTSEPAQKKLSDLKLSPFGGPGLFSNGSNPSLFNSTSPVSEKAAETLFTPIKPPSATAFEKAPETSAFAAFSSAATKPSRGLPFGTASMFGQAGSLTKPATEPTKETSTPAKSGLFDFGTTSSSFGAPGLSAPSNGGFSASSASKPVAPAVASFSAAFGTPSASTSVPTPTTSLFGKPSTSLVFPTAPSGGKEETTAIAPSTKPITFNMPSGFKSPFGDSSKTSATAFGSGPSPFAAFRPATSNGASLFGSPSTKTPIASEPPTTKDVDMDSTQADSTSMKITSKEATLPTFAFSVQTLSSLAKNAGIPTPEDKLPSFSFDVKAVAKGSSFTTVPPPAAKVAPAPVVAFDFAAAGMSAPTTSAATWECPVCMIPNKTDVIKCAACETDRPGVASSSAVKPAISATIIPPAPSLGFNFAAAGMAKPISSAGAWKCPVCMISNNSNDAKCAACETARPWASSSVEPVPEPPKPIAPPVVNNWAGIWAPPAAPSGKVTCKHCGLLTDKGLEKCQVCDVKDYE